MQHAWVGGVDGCAGGWMVVWRPVDDAACAELKVVPTFGDVLRAPRVPCVIAVDMPIGLPEFTARGGREPDAALRPSLGARQSSLFSVPSRTAVYAETYAAACRAALATSEPPRKVSKQVFALLPKIREIDALLRSNGDLATGVFECHPEGSFRIMAGTPLVHPKKAKSSVHERGLAERRCLLAAAGYPAELLSGPPPAGAQCDDLLDACAAAWTAARIASGTALSWPRRPAHDALGLPMAIWT